MSDYVGSFSFPEPLGERWHQPEELRLYRLLVGLLVALMARALSGLADFPAPRYGYSSSPFLWALPLFNRYPICCQP
jgi:hypothetical protein